MMKCQFCGSNIDIESDVCPFCGLSKSQFESHREDMRDYSDAFHATREGVVKQNQKFSSNAASITVLSVLVIGILILFICLSQNYDIYEAVQSTKALRNASTHIERLDAELAEGNYETFYRYFYAQELISLDRDNPTFAKYQLVNYFAAQYSYTMSSFYNFLYWNENDYSTHEERLNRFAKQYSAFLDYYNKHILEPGEYRSYPDASYDAEMIAHVHTMKANLDQCMMTYMGIDEQTLSDMISMSEAHRIVTLEEFALNQVSSTDGKEDVINEQ